MAPIWNAEREMLTEDEKNKEEEAATKIQAVVRGIIERKKLAEWRAFKDSILCPQLKSCSNFETSTVKASSKFPKITPRVEKKDHMGLEKCSESDDVQQWESSPLKSRGSALLPKKPSHPPREYLHISRLSIVKPMETINKTQSKPRPYLHVSPIRPETITCPSPLQPQESFRSTPITSSNQSPRSTPHFQRPKNSTCTTNDMTPHASKKRQNAAKQVQEWATSRKEGISHISKFCYSSKNFKRNDSYLLFNFVFIIDPM